MEPSKHMMWSILEHPVTSSQIFQFRALHLQPNWASLQFALKCQQESTLCLPLWWLKELDVFYSCPAFGHGLGPRAVLVLLVFFLLGCYLQENQHFLRWWISTLRTCTFTYKRISSFCMQKHYKQRKLKISRSMIF